LKTKILFVTNVDWFFISHRILIAEEAIKSGFEVIVATTDTGRSKEIIEKGIQFVNLPISRSGINPIKESITLLRFYFVYKKINPDIVHHVTLKPIIYGSIISKFLKIKYVINAVSGLGYNFTGERMGLISKIIILLMRFGFNRKKVSLIFQNQDDYIQLLSLNVIASTNTIYRIKGSGVDLNVFKTYSYPEFDKIKILLPCRMLWDKGVRELYEASIFLRPNYENRIQIILCGSVDNENKASVPRSFLESWQDGEFIKWIGFQNDMFQVYKESHIVVLPSYREGMPKSLIEACSMGRAIITTWAIGCKECVDEGINGLKVPIKNSRALADAIEQLINNPEKIIQMGKASRLKAEVEFDINLVVRKHLDIYKGIKNVCNS
jgi:glycosyltransferase involved in cell wall biosynthesis